MYELISIKMLCSCGYESFVISIHQKLDVNLNLSQNIQRQQHCWYYIKNEHGFFLQKSCCESGYLVWWLLLLLLLLWLHHLLLLGLLALEQQRMLQLLLPVQLRAALHPCGGSSHALPHGVHLLSLRGVHAVPSHLPLAEVGHGRGGVPGPPATAGRPYPCPACPVGTCSSAAGRVAACWVAAAAGSCPSVGSGPYRVGSSPAACPGDSSPSTSGGP